MSRIGKSPLMIPKGVTVDINGVHVKIKGPKGTLERDIRPEVELVESDGILLVKCRDNSKRTDAFSGLTRSLVNNMIQGVDKGFEKKLIIEGVGYKAEVSGSILTLNVGYSNPVKFNLPDKVKADADKSGIKLESIDKELLGLTAARIRAVRKPEPYKGKGIRYENEHIVRKVGKAAGKAL
ncbi:MAG: 50S ribosomal protein L6 [Desulfobulbaceae bacterium]|nr:50S ribosomal protein L6 [Desulfobulbaceae bacterium]MCK5322645.1 50S ribosomal protein L6 [Desulfobulbaceae bacterium]MCK5437971.1 50S ribosomal protein L6 [Desulfobulbaceae bacterium]MCK5544231.1 50S ribosomal protein L6 [Desulfobulbaceae bacterium]